MSTPFVTFKKAPRRPNQSRKRSASPISEDPGPSTSSGAGAATSSVIIPTKKSIVNPLVQGTKRRRDLNEQSEDGAGLDDFDYKADEGLTQKGDAFATRSTDYDLETSEGGRPAAKVKLNEVSQKRALGLEDRTNNQDGEIDDGMYRGAANYHKHLTKRTDVMDKKMTHGPIRATANVRTITLMDYQPDVCKDYKETGFCGYGDSCKFLHDRGDYLAGWQMDKVDPNSGQPVVEEDDEEEEVPFACLICRQPFTDPVITKCGHYFCMQ
jgi:RING finger protein 113A